MSTQQTKTNIDPKVYKAISEALCKVGRRLKEDGILRTSEKQTSAAKPAA